MWNEFNGTVYCNELPGNATNSITCNNTDVLHKSCSDIIPPNWLVLHLMVLLYYTPNSNLTKTICGGRVLELIDLSEFNVWWNIILMGVIGMIYMTISLLGFVKATRRKWMIFHWKFYCVCICVYFTIIILIKFLLMNSLHNNRFIAISWLVTKYTGYSNFILQLI